MSNIITAWSYSSYSLFKTCKYAWEQRWIHKIKDDTYNPAFARGTEIHAKAEYLVKGKVKGMPKELKKFAYEFKEIIKLGATAEGDLSITRDLKPTTATDWNGVWCRIKVDARVPMGDVSTVIDYKTGKVYPANEDQIGLYAVGERVHNPEAKTIDTELWYLDTGDVVTRSYTAKEVDALIKDWQRKVKPMFTRQKRYPATPSHKCRFCMHAADKGGTCIYNTRGEKE